MNKGKPLINSPNHRLSACRTPHDRFEAAAVGLRITLSLAADKTADVCRRIRCLPAKAMVNAGLEYSTRHKGA